MRVETDNLNKRFGGVVALEEVTMDFSPSTVTAIIGPNGAGKTTLFNVMAGFLKPDSGSVNLMSDQADSGPKHSQDRNQATDIVGLAPHQIAARGIGVSALENVAVGVKNQAGEKPVNCFFRRSVVRREEKDVMEKSGCLLEYVGLSDKSHLLAEQLSYGQQKLVALARLLAGDARVLLLDEPTSGVHPDMIDKLLDLIQRLADDDGRTVVMIEHNLNVVKRVGDWVYLMAGGRIEVFGKAQEVLRDSTLQEIFPTL